MELRKVKSFTCGVPVDDDEIFNQEEILCWTSVQTTVCTSMDEITKKVSVPEWMRDGLSKIQE